MLHFRAMDLGLNDRVALVTGASKGIGGAIAAALVAEGAQVAITSRSEERVSAAADEIGATGFVHDSADLDAVPAKLEEIETALGPVDVLVTNTGGPPASPDALSHERPDWEAAHRNLVLFPMALVEQVLPGMRERKWGRVLNVSSTAALEPIPHLMLSNAHRSGLLAAFKTIARQVAADGVTLNTLLTGRIDTDRLIELGGSREAVEAAAAEQIPIARLGTVDEYAAVAAFLCSEPARYVTGTALPVDGGLMRGL